MASASAKSTQTMAAIHAARRDSGSSPPSIRESTPPVTIKNPSTPLRRMPTGNPAMRKRRSGSIGKSTALFPHPALTGHPLPRTGEGQSNRIRAYFFLLPREGEGGRRPNERTLQSLIFLEIEHKNGGGGRRCGRAFFGNRT